MLLISLIVVSEAYGELFDLKATKQPNIIYIMLDDLDYYDLGVYGSPDIHTETIDKFASEGMRFTHYYTNGPVCSPTRVAILTGHYPAHFGVKRAISETSFRGIPGRITTLPEMLREEGYNTAHIGKWHVGTGKEEFLPRNSGFNYSVRLETSAGLSYLDFVLSINDEENISYRNQTHLTEVLTTHAINFINDTLENAPDQPFFLNLWYLAPHKPLDQVPKNFDNSSTNYCIDSDPAKRTCDSPRGNFSALVTNADRQIKRLLDHVDNATNLRENTIVFITSDNGGSKKTHNSRVVSERKLRGFKGSVYDGAIRVPLIVRWPGVIPKNTVNESVVSSFDLFSTLIKLTGTRLVIDDLPGTSFLDALLTNSLITKSSPLFWENKHANKAFANTSGIFNTYAVRNGDWKLIFIPARNKHDQDSIQLFNLRFDPSENNNLLSRQVKRFIDFNFMNFNFGIVNKNTPSDSDADRYRLLVDDMQHRYYQWRRDQGDIQYSPKLSGSGVHLVDSVLQFKGGNASIDRDVRFDFNDGDFSFAAWINPSWVSGRSVVAEKPGSWRILIDEGSLQLVLIGQKQENNKDQPTMTLKAPIKENMEQHVAFTVFGWRDDPSTVRLYLNGELVDESTAAKTVKKVNSQDLPDMPMIFLGGDSENRVPYHGTMSIPRFSVLSFYPSEVFWDYTRPLLWKHRVAGQR